jgi:hypothetical protein
VGLGQARRGAFKANQKCRDVVTASRYGRTMPRYYFHTRIEDELIRDPEGAELRDPDHAWTMARAMIRDILNEEATEPRLLRAAIEVTDEDGDVVLEFPFSEALVEPGHLSHSVH